MEPRTRLDREVLELLADDPELLAIADAFTETQAPRRRVRPLGLAAAGLALVAAVTLAVAVWPGGGSSGISGNTAYAAVGGASRVLEISVVGDASPFSLRLDRRAGELVVRDSSGSLRAPAALLPPASRRIPANVERSVGAAAGPVLSLLLEYPAIARAGHLQMVPAPESRYQHLRWISYRSALGYDVEVGLERRFLQPVAVTRASSARVVSVSVSTTN